MQPKNEWLRQDRMGSMEFVPLLNKDISIGTDHDSFGITPKELGRARSIGCHG